MRKNRLLAMILSVGLLASATGAASVYADSTSSSDNTMTVALSTGGLTYVQNSTNINNNPYVLALDKLSGVHLQLQLIQWSAYQQQMTQLMASGNLPDLLQTEGINDPTIVPAVQAKQFWSLNQLIDKYGPNLKKYIPKSSWDDARVSQDGVIYGIPQPNPILNGEVIYVRKDWMDKLHLQTPKTVDQYIKVLEAFKKYKPDGQHHAIPFSGRQKLNFMDFMFGAYDVIPPDWKYVNGQLVPNFIRPQMKQALAIYQKMYNEGLIDPESFTQTGTQWDQKIKGQGIVGMFQQSSAYPNLVYSQMLVNNPQAQLEFISAPVGPDGKGGMSLGSTVGSWVWVIPKSNPHPEQVIKFLNWMYTPQAEKFFLYGIKGRDYLVSHSKVVYRYPITPNEQQEQIFHQTWLRFAGPLQQFTDENFLKGEPNGQMVLQALKVSRQEGRLSDGLDMPQLPETQQNPSLNWDGLWLTYAENVITGKDSLSNFDSFVANWKKIGGDEVIKEATAWYKQTHKSH